jgi:uncharacterized protein (TIGR03435 family)
MIRTMAGMVLAVLMCWGTLDGQTADGQPTFEVASVRPAPPYMEGQDVQMRGGPGTDDPGQFTAPRASLMSLLATTYGVARDQISGPDWLTTELYSVAAKIPPNTTKDRFNLMLQNLLAERFHLTLHHGTKDFTVYELVVAEGGPKMTASANQPAPDRKGFPVLPPGRRMAINFNIQPVRATCRETMAQFAEHLGGWVNMSNGDGIVRGSPPAPHVIDKTGLTGEFDFTLEFAGSVFFANSPEANAAGDQGGHGLSLFAALEKQLGLKLEKKKAGLDVLVIDHVDKVPTEN